MAEQALKDEVIAIVRELDPEQLANLSGPKLDFLVKFAQKLRPNDQRRAGAWSQADETAATPSEQEISAVDCDESSLLDNNNAASDTSSLTLAENMEDVESVTSGDLLFTGTARLGSGKRQASSPQGFFDKASYQLTVRVHIDSERLQMVQRLPSLNQNVGRLRATCSALEDIEHKIFRLRNGFTLPVIENAWELALSSTELLIWCRVFKECIAAFEDLVKAQRVLCNMTQEEQDCSEISYDFLKAWD